MEAFFIGGLLTSMCASSPIIRTINPSLIKTMEMSMVQWVPAAMWLTGVILMQGVVITDPHLMAEVLQSKEFDKEPRTYRAMDSVCPWQL